jgi:cytochrome P450
MVDTIMVDVKASSLVLATAGAFVTWITYRLFFKASSKQDLSKLPPWVTLEMALITILCKGNGTGRKIMQVSVPCPSTLFPNISSSSIRRYAGSLYGITSRHQVLVDLPNSDRFHSMPGHSVTTLAHQFTMMERVFGATEPDTSFEQRGKCWESLTKHVSNLFLHDANSSKILQSSDIPKLAASLVSFTPNPADQHRWEQSANIKVITSETTPGTGIVEADLLHLVRDFGANLAIQILYGSDFLSRNPTLLSDFWTFDNEAFILLILGLPSWTPLPAMRRGIEARTRLHDALVSLYTRLDAHLNGQPTDADLTDVSACARGRSAVYAANNYTLTQRGRVDLGLLWGQNANTQPMIFWYLVHAFSTPGLITQLREETAPHVTITPSTSPSSPPTLTNIDINALTHACPLTKSTLFEVYRLCNDATSIRYIARPVTLPDANGLSHTLAPGTFLSTPHGLHQLDPTHYPSPQTFKPDRFVTTDPKSGAKSAKYGALKPWGAGQGICKGRTFAEKEILALVVAIFQLWDISPAEEREDWAVPHPVPGTGAMMPSHEVRVRIQRRRIIH